MLNSLWVSHSETTSFERLKEDMHVDVAIIGGGMSGISAAQALTRQGLKVAVYEKGNVGMSSSGFSTGNLYSAMGELLIHTRKKFGDEVLKKVVNARREAIDFIEDNIKTYNIDCDFKRVRFHNYTTKTGSESKVREAQKAAQLLDLDYRESDLRGLPFFATRSFSLDGAAQFNPLRYVQGLAKGIAQEGCQIFEQTEILEIHEEEHGVKLVTNKGYTIWAGYLIHATHTPKGISAYHTQLGPYREYGVACKIKGTHPEGVYFGYFEPSDITSTRIYERDGQQYLVCVGAPHKVGHGDSVKQMNKMERFAREHFEVIEVTHRWGAQNYKAPDYLPFIGQKMKGSRQYIATGFSSHGLTYGALSGLILSDLITGKANQYADIFRPTRFNPVKSAPKFIKENTDVMFQYVNDYFVKKHPNNFESIYPGEGQVIEQEGHKLAACKDEQGGVRVCSAVCTHLGGIVHWNGAEKSWDCPIHGTRFGTGGEVLEGPALLPLKSMDEVMFGKSAESYSDQTAVMSDEDKIDEAGLESFPASDPPAHRT